MSIQENQAYALNTAEVPADAGAYADYTVRLSEAARSYILPLYHRKAHNQVTVYDISIRNTYSLCLSPKICEFQY